MSDWLARTAYGADYAEACLTAGRQAPTALCTAAAGTGLQQALLLLGLFLLVAIACYAVAARSIAGEIAAIERSRS